MDSPECVDDSGIDSDQKCINDFPVDSPIKDQPLSRKDSTISKAYQNKTSQLQKQIEKQRDNSRKQQLHKSGNYTKLPNEKLNSSKSRLIVPAKQEAYSPNASDSQPLVLLSDDSDDEFSFSTSSREVHREITQQLIKDGYNLDLEPDDEDLDLIPPRSIKENCACCSIYTTCSIL